MGLAFTIDTPVKVARFGINSVISIVEDRLIETMRSYYYSFINRPFRPISTQVPDYRAKRITDYLNLVNTIVQEQIQQLRNSAFETGSEIIKYFEMIPEDNPLKSIYRSMMATGNPEEKKILAEYLRSQVVPGSIDVNIMTKVDKDNFSATGELLEDASDAVAALRGYAQSNLTNSSIIFSAGLNPRLYNYLEKCDQFNADDQGHFRKKVVIKVSDYRSALIQGKYLAKKGIWVSEFRVESGLNCGGHAFATDGFLLGPILEEFKSKKPELTRVIFDLYNAAIKAKGQVGFTEPHTLRITAQGGIGTAAEDDFLHRQYELDSTGWGSPFLLVPEATTVDDDTLNALVHAKQTGLVLSNNSPLGVRFYHLSGTSADTEKAARISAGRPGSPCTEKHLAFNTEFTTQPICTASRKYQQLKIAQLNSLNLSKEDFEAHYKKVTEKECLCIGLSNSAAAVYQVPFLPKLKAVTVCPGPNLLYFDQVVSLKTMTDHIYGRTDLLAGKVRPHMFIAELNLYIDYLKELIGPASCQEPDTKTRKYVSCFYNNLKDGIRYYRQLPGLPEDQRHQFIIDLNLAEITLDGIAFDFQSR